MTATAAAAAAPPPMSTHARERTFLAEVPPAALAVIGEGAWIALLYEFVQDARGEPAPLNVVWFAAWAAIGLVVARRFDVHLAGTWAWAIVGLMVAAGAVGWIADGTARDELLSGHLASAVLRHQGGFLTALALLRGISHAQPASSEVSLARLIAWGTPLLAVPLLIAQALHEPAHSAFEGQALGLCLLFVLSTTLGLALIRVANLGRRAGFGWSRNRTWLVVALGVSFVAVVLLPATFLVGPAVRVVVALALPPLLLIALIAGLGTITLRSVAIVLLVGVAVFAISRLAFIFVPNLGGDPSQQSASGPNSQDPTVTVFTWLPILAVSILLIVLLVRRWLRRRPTGAPPG